MRALILAASMLLVACGGSGDRPALLALGADVYVQSCLRCHGRDGGGGQGPALEEVELDWPGCTDMIEWISVGSNAWPSPVYGARAKPVNGGMGGFGDLLSEAELAGVAAYVRAEFGGVTDTVGCA